ncbi:hypothetical protein V8F06_013389 [Rhypophila decipiens]
MAPNLIPFGPEGLTALYDTTKRLLIVAAAGEIASFWMGPYLTQDPLFVGGFKFSLLGYPGGILPAGASPTQNIDIEDKTYVSLPQEYFRSDSVIVQTGSGPHTVPIRYTGLPDNTGAGETTSDLAKDLNKLSITSVLPPQSRILPGGRGHRLILSARLPQPGPEPAPSSVGLHFNPVFFTLCNSWISNGSIFWTIKWAKFPAGAENPQLVEVETDTDIQFPPTEMRSPARISKIIQGYIVFGTLLEKQEEKKDGEGKKN